MEKKPEVRNLISFGIDKIYQLLFLSEDKSSLRDRSPQEFAAMAQYVRVAIIEGQVLGTYGLIPYGQGLEVVLLWVSPGYRGNGYSLALLKLAVGEARSSSCEFVFACTTADSVKAIFERAGFIAVSRGDVPAEKWLGYPADREPIVMKRAAL